MIARLCVACVGSMLLWAMLAGGSAAAPPTCSAAAADTLEKRLPVGPFDKRRGQNLCIDFTGDGKVDIVFTGWEFVNNGAHYWAAFRATDVGWASVIFKRDCCRVRRASGIRIKRSGTRTILVTQPIYKANDRDCCPTGGTRTGRWRWVAGRLKLISVSPKPEPAASTP